MVASTPNEPQQIYWIGCSGTGYVLMEEERLENVFDEMPTLRYLLMGHPQMAQPSIQQRADGTKVLEIPHELEIHQSSFLLLVNCLVGMEPLPPRNAPNSRLTELSETVTKLGGCVSLENRVKDRTANPMTPEEDVENQYTWAVIQYDTIFQRRMHDMMERGYSYTTTKKVFHTDFHYFRANKPAEERNDDDNVDDDF